MSTRCSCNRLREAEAALGAACKEIAALLSECPRSACGWESPECSDGCSDDYAACWRKALSGKQANAGGWEYRFPPVMDVPGSIDGQIGKVSEEVSEVARASFLETEWRVAEELMDVIHAAETALRMIEGDPGVDMDGVMRGVIEKNRKRGFYGGDGR